ncbi:hypothetical protein Gohar_026921 [Gossypium harknessii]|uniref:RNase H type-1 domain-containing protein n=1 Tax=Gossypium harknessii TaxID=34285 RepID=A0A7J9HT67_9ROSI|nr:hypothetical protein [Gossypium harknessii]
MTIHALKDCSKAHEILSLGGLDGRLLDYKFERCIDWLKEEEDTKVAWEQAKTLGDNFRIHNLTNAVDAAIVDTSTGIRVIVLDSDGFVLGRLAKYRESQIKMDWAEVEALREGINWARNNNVVRAIFETNCARLVNRIKKHHEDITIFGYRLKEIVGLLDFFTKAKINWIDRTSNRVADSLSKLALNKQCTLSFSMEYPYDIHELVMIDSC